MAESPESFQPPQDNSAAAEKVRSFPHTPGVYLMKDAAGRVIYIGKAKNLRARAGSYFLKAAAEDQRTARLVQEIRDIDFLEAESEVDALLMEARLIKDLLPKYNRDLRDDKTFPYLEIRTLRGLSPRRRHADAAGARLEALRAVHQFAVAARGVGDFAEGLQVSHLLPGHRRRRRPLAMVSPVPAGLDRPVLGAVQPAHFARNTGRTSTACKRSWKGKENRSCARCAKTWPRRRRN